MQTSISPCSNMITFFTKMGSSMNDGTPLFVQMCVDAKIP